jgi:hypothetical protein
VAVSPDGRTAITAGDDGLVRVWDLENGQELERLVGHTGRVQCVAFTLDGHAVSGGGSQDKTIRIWDITTGREERCWRGHEGFISDLAVSADGRFLASSGEYGSVKKWALPASYIPEPDQKDAPSPLVRNFKGKITDVTRGGCGRFLLLTMKDPDQLAIFDINQVDVVKYIPLPDEEVLVAAGAEMFILAFPNRHVFQRWDLETLKRKSEMPLPFPGRLQGLAMGCDSGGPMLAVWDPPGKESVVGLERLPLSLIDPTTARVLVVRYFNDRSNTQGDELPAPSALFTVLRMGGQVYRHLGASNDSSLFTVGNRIIAIEGGGVEAGQPQTGRIRPSADGERVYVLRSWSVDRRGRRATIDHRQEALEFCVPTTDPRFFLEHKRRLDRPGLPFLLAVITSQGERLYETADLEEINPPPVESVAKFSGDFRAGLAALERRDKERRESRHATADHEAGLQPDELASDKRLHLIPAAQTLVTIPRQRDRLVLRRLDIDVILKRHEKSKDPQRSEQ